MECSIYGRYRIDQLYNYYYVVKERMDKEDKIENLTWLLERSATPLPTRI